MAPHPPSPMQKHADILQGLRVAFRNIFMHTLPRPTEAVSSTGFLMKSSQTGPRSLVETALRKFPVYAAIEQIFHDEDNPDSREDITPGLLEELEDLLKSMGRVSHLATVVRSQALFIFRQAIYEGLIPASEIYQLTSLPFNGKKTDLHVITLEEGQYLLQAWLERTPAMRCPSSAHDHVSAMGPPRSKPEVAIFTMTQRWETFGASCSTYQQLLVSGKLPVEWFATEQMGLILSRAMMAVATGRDSSMQVSRFLSTVVLHCCGLPLNASSAIEDESVELPRTSSSSPPTIRTELIEPFNAALDLTMETLAIPLFTIAYNPNGAIDPKGQAYELLQNIAADIIRSLRDEKRTYGATEVRRMFHFLFTALLLNLVHDSNGSPVDHDRFNPCAQEPSLTEDILESMNRMAQQIESAPALLRRIASLCHRATKASEQVHLQQIQEYLRPIAASTRLPQAVARRFANVCREIDGELHPANSIERIGAPSGERARNEIHRGQVDPPPAQEGYYWEEGIEEWVLESLDQNLLGAFPRVQSQSLIWDNLPRSSASAEADILESPDWPPGECFERLESECHSCARHNNLSPRDAEAETTDEGAAPAKRDQGPTPIEGNNANAIPAEREDEVTHPAEDEVVPKPRTSSAEIRARIAHLRRRSGCRRSSASSTKRRRSSADDSGFVSDEEAEVEADVVEAPMAKRGRLSEPKTSLTVSALALRRGEDSDDELSFL